MQFSDLWCLFVHVVCYQDCTQAQTKEVAAQKLFRLFLVVLQLVSTAVEIGRLKFVSDSKHEVEANTGSQIGVQAVGVGTVAARNKEVFGADGVGLGCEENVGNHKFVLA